jgi:hypothetical protein
LLVSISNNQRSILEYAKQVVGAGKITRKRVYGVNHADAYTYSIANRQALALLGQIVQHMKGYKAQRAELVLNDYVRLTPRNGKYNQALLAERERFVEAFFSLSP